MSGEKTFRGIAVHLDEVYPTLEDRINDTPQTICTQKIEFTRHSMADIRMLKAQGYSISRMEAESE